MREGGSILSLDIATNTGWAYGKPGEVPRSGTVRLAGPGSSNGAKGRGFLVWFTEFIAVSQVDAIHYEVPIDPRHMGGKTTFLTTRLLVGLPLLLETLAEASGIFHIREADVQDVRKYFVGKARPVDKKLAVQQRCRELGWQFADDNAADALALWAFACAYEVPRSSIATAPLFQKPVPAALKADAEPRPRQGKSEARRAAEAAFKPAQRGADIEDIDP